MAPRFAAAAGNQVVFITYSPPARENQPWREFARSSAGRHFNRPTPLIAICA